MASKQKVVAVASLLNAALVWGLIRYPFRALALGLLLFYRAPLRTVIW